MENSVDVLRPKFRQVAIAFGEMVSAYVLPIRFPGYKYRVTETLRSKERQVALEASGASKVKLGYHNFGLALDFALTDDTGVYVANGTHAAYLACGQVAESLGCVWGGRWAGLMDAGHIELRPNGMTIQQLIAAEATGGLIA